MWVNLQYLFPNGVGCRDHICALIIRHPIEAEHPFEGFVPLLQWIDLFGAIFERKILIVIVAKIVYSMH